MMDPLSEAWEDLVGVSAVVKVDGGLVVVVVVVAVVTVVAVVAVVVESVLPVAFAVELLSNSAAANISAEAVTLRSEDVNI
jgi:hypothetical protein